MPETLRYLPDKARDLGQNVTSFLKRTPRVTYPQLEHSIFPDHLRGSENSTRLAGLSILPSFDLDAWERTTTEIVEYVGNRTNIVRSKKGKKCIDGRYDAEDSQGMIARPGGDYGYALVLAALTDPNSAQRIRNGFPELTPEQSFDAVFNAVTADGDKFYMHTDSHDDGNHFGCGHANAPMQHGTWYQLGEEGRANDLLTVARERIQEDLDHGRQKVHVEVVPGEHAEDALAIILGKKRTMKSQNKETNNMYFVYNITNDYNYMVQRLIPALAKILHIPDAKHKIFFSQFLYLASLQANNSLDVLAPFAPRVTVDLDHIRPKITMLAPKTKIDLRAKFEGKSETGLVSDLPDAA